MVDVELGAKRHMRFHEIQDFIVCVILLLDRHPGRIVQYMTSRANPRLVGGLVDELMELGLAADIEFDNPDQNGKAVTYAKAIGLRAFAANGSIHVALVDAASS